MKQHTCDKQPTSRQSTTPCSLGPCPIYTYPMVFTKRLRDRIRSGEITISIRIWQSPRVTIGRRYKMEEGEIEIDSIVPIGLPDITPQLARKSGFLGVLDLLKVAKHGQGQNIYLIRFHYIPPSRVAAQPGRPISR